MRYSQNNEQDIILAYFGDHIGTFLDLGANDGQTLSNTRALALKGWKGLLVDASKTACWKASVLYPPKGKVVIVNRAVSNYKGLIKFHESGAHLGNGDVSLVSTVVEAELDRWKGTANTFTETEVRCDTVSGIIKGAGFEAVAFDFISIDIEGMDYEVLTQIDLSGTKMVCVEFNGKEPHKYIDYCATFGLKELARNGENLIFAR